jgi:hypothetical protein
MRIIFTFLLVSFIVNADAQRCGTTEYLQQNKSAFTFTPPPSTASGGRDTLPNEVITIPVIIHVLYNNTAQNISDQQILSQLAVLNNDYRRLNADAVNTPAPFASVAAESRIIFCLAKVDTNGNYTSGIIRKYTSQTIFQANDDMKFSSSGGDDGWNSQKYLNIWVCNLTAGTLGYAVMPGGPADRDGVVIQYDAFGTIGNVSAPFDKGRTTTHEIGHWLGLRHTWGDAICGDDGIADTPPQQTYTIGCPSFPRTSSCSINSYGDMFMNYMDFTNDACMNLFTHDQAIEMRSLFALGGYRNTFLNSSVCGDSLLAQGAPNLPDSTETTSPAGTTTNTAKITVYPNPFSSQIFIGSNNPAELAGTTVRLYDITGKLYKVQLLQSAKNSLSVGDLPSGIYFLKLEGGNNPQVFKLIK